MKNPTVRIISLFFSGCILWLLNGCGVGDDPAVPVSNSLSELKHSHISLMHGGGSEESEVIRLLQPAVIAWGNDPVGDLDDLEPFRKRLERYRDGGVILQASNAWILTATSRVLYHQPEYQEAVCVDIGGVPIVPPWLDGNYEGVPSYWGCTNDPLFRSHAKERVIAGASSGATMQHIDDHLGTYAASIWAGACFCEHCMEDLRIWLTEKYTESELNSMEIEDPDSFNYADLIRSMGITNLDEYQEASRQDRLPMREDFLDFQRESAAAFIKVLGTVADSAAGTDLPIGVNAYNLAPTQLATSHNADYFSNEVQHYGHEDSIPPLTFMIGTAIAKPVFATGSGVDWVQAQLDKTVTRVQRWIANAYAFGHYFMYAYNQWGFSPETGTMWYQVPISIFEPMCSFITENKHLFDGFEPVAQVGLLYDNAACSDGDWWVREVNRDLHYANIPTSLVIQGDKHLQFSTDPGQLEAYELLVAPKSILKKEPVSELVVAAREKGKLLEWNGTEDLLSRINPGIVLKNGDMIWTLPRQKKSGQQAELVIHLLNQDYDPDSDLMNKKTDIGVFVNQQLTGGSPAKSAWIYAPGSEPVELIVEEADGGAKIIVPELDLWAIVNVK